MLAYSSIAHAGYLLVALVSANDVGKGAVLFYLLAYAVTNLGAFGVTALVATRDRPNDELRDYAGLWNAQPLLAALMTIFLLSLGGFPPIAGFIAKWYSFSAAIKAGYYGAGDHRRADERRLGLLLPARRRDDVHGRRDVDRAGHAAVCRVAVRAGGADRRDVLSRHPADARPRLAVDRSRRFSRTLLARALIQSSLYRSLAYVQSVSRNTGPQVR